MAQYENSQGHEQFDEARLLRRARALDQDALAWVYQNYHSAIYRYVYHHLGVAQTAEDLTSEVFRRFLQALRNGGGPTRQLRAWLYRVAHNLIVDHVRRGKHRNHEPLDGTLGETLADSAEGPERLAARTIVMEHVRGAMLELTEEQRQVVILKFLEGMSNAEVSALTGKTVGAVKALQHRGLETLRAQLVTSQAPDLAPAMGEGVTLPAW
jgi:RNA polymerase sigma-70 factor (ECF subfamily)